MTKLSNELFPEAECELWPQAEYRAARRKEYGISLHSPLDDEHPALTYMTAEESKRYLAAASDLVKAKRARNVLVAESWPELPSEATNIEKQTIAGSFSSKLREELLQQLSPECSKHYAQLGKGMADSLSVIELILNGVIDRLPEKKHHQGEGNMTALSVDLYEKFKTQHGFGLGDLEYVGRRLSGCTD
jgi:hypothetical protein